MPIWIKAILFCWFGLTPFAYISFRIWCQMNPLKVLTKDVPKWAISYGILIIIDILTILPVIFWFIFLR